MFPSSNLLHFAVENEKQKDLVYEVDILKLENIKYATLEPENCKPYSEWRVFRFRDIEGITLIRNVFSEEHQLLWAQRCIQVKSQLDRSSLLFLSTLTLKNSELSSQNG